MFEISWSELLIVGVVALIFVGPKDLPGLFNTLGRYAGMVKRQANEFRQHFETAMREAELESLRKEMDGVRDQVNASVMAAERETQSGMSSARAQVEAPVYRMPLGSDPPPSNKANALELPAAAEPEPDAAPPSQQDKAPSPSQAESKG